MYNGFEVAIFNQFTAAGIFKIWNFLKYLSFFVILAQKNLEIKLHDGRNVYNQCCCSGSCASNYGLKISYEKNFFQQVKTVQGLKIGSLWRIYTSSAVNSLKNVKTSLKRGDAWSIAFSQNRNLFFHFFAFDFADL